MPNILQQVFNVPCKGRGKSKAGGGSCHAGDHHVENIHMSYPFSLSLMLKIFSHGEPVSPLYGQVILTRSHLGLPGNVSYFCVKKSNPKILLPEKSNSSKIPLK